MMLFILTILISFVYFILNVILYVNLIDLYQGPFQLYTHIFHVI